MDPSSSIDVIKNNSVGESLKFFIDFVDLAECCESTPYSGFKYFKKNEVKHPIALGESSLINC